MTRLCKFVLPFAAAAALAAPGMALACDYHGVSVSLPASESVAQTPAPSTPAPMPGSNG